MDRRSTPSSWQQPCFSLGQILSKIGLRVLFKAVVKPPINGVDLDQTSVISVVAFDLRQCSSVLLSAKNTGATGEQEACHG